MGCCCNNDPAGDGDCAHVADLIRSCQKWYGTQSARDTVDAATLAGVLENIANQINRHSVAFGQLLREDCTLRDGLILCRHLSDEIGVSCLIGRGGEPPTPPAPPGPQPGGPILNSLPIAVQPDGAWSLRRTTVDYDGPLIRIRRALDNSEQDIYTDDTNLVDTAAIVAFAQNSDVYVSVWYDQIKQYANLDLSQSTPANQPKIYDSISGFILTPSGRLAMEFSQVAESSMRNDIEQIIYSVRFLSVLAFNVLLKGTHFFCVFGREPSTPRIGLRQSAVVFNRTLQATITENEPVLVALAGNDDTAYNRQNGVVLESKDAPTQSVVYGPTAINAYGGSTYSHIQIQEWFAYGDTPWATEIEPGQTALSLLEQNMMATWGITPG